MRSARRFVLALPLSLGLVLASSEARAFEFGTPAKEFPHTSAQNFAIEFRFSPYKAAVDDEPGLTGTPFADRFGTKPRLAIGLEFDWQTFRIPYIGTIGPGLGLALVTMGRSAQTLSGRATRDEYSLTIYPAYLAAVLRMDALWRKTRFPLVPYGKLGLSAALWRASNAGGISEVNGVSGKGITFGTHFAGGVAFPLDVFDHSASRAMDNAAGINNTYLYGEYYWLNLNGLGQDGALYVGTTSWAVGLAFEF